MSPVVDGRVVECSRCHRLACVCQVKESHDLSCPFRVATTCPVAIECRHGYDVCPECDPCTCG